MQLVLMPFIDRTRDLSIFSRQPPTSARSCSRQFFTLDAAAAADPDADGAAAAAAACKKVFGFWVFVGSLKRVLLAKRRKPARSAGYF